MADSVTSVTSAPGSRGVEDSQPTGSASDLLRAATDPRTGVVNTGQLAGWIADAARQNFDSASTAYRQIDARLSKTDPATAGYFSRDVADAFAAQQSGDGSSPSAFTGPLWAAGNGISEAGKTVLRNNPILEVRWISTPNAKNEAGFTRGLEELLSSKGIQYQQYPRLSTLNPDPAPKYRTYNGRRYDPRTTEWSITCPYYAACRSPTPRTRRSRRPMRSSIPCSFRSETSAPP